MKEKKGNEKEKDNNFIKDHGIFVRCALSLWPKAENRFQVDNGRILRNGALVVECKIAPFVFFGSPPRKLRFSQRALANISMVGPWQGPRCLNRMAPDDEVVFPLFISRNFQCSWFYYVLSCPISCLVFIDGEWVVACNAKCSSIKNALHETTPSIKTQQAMGRYGPKDSER